MKNKIKQVVKLPQSTTGPNNSTINWYHVYTVEPTFNQDPRGVMVQETVNSDGGKFYNVKPLGNVSNPNVIYANAGLATQQNEAVQFVEWFNTLDQREIANLIYGRELLRG